MRVEYLYIGIMVLVAVYLNRYWQWREWKQLAEKSSTKLALVKEDLDLTVSSPEWPSFIDISYDQTETADSYAQTEVEMEVHNV